MELFSCQICLETADSDSIVKCMFCAESCCEDCFQKESVMNRIFPRCMFCKLTFPLKFFLLNCRTRWLKSTFVPFFKELLYERDEPINHQLVVEKNRKKEKYATERQLRTQIRRIREHHCDDMRMFDRNGELHTCQICLDAATEISGLQLELLTKTEMKLEVKKTFICKCPRDACRGLVGMDHKCEECLKKICPDCYEAVEQEHKCSRDAIRNQEFIKNNSRSCPNCYVPIIRSEGCNQMFCTYCTTSFDYVTGQIVTKNIHNPHYFEWLQKGRLKTEENDCEDVRAKFRKINNEFFYDETCPPEVFDSDDSENEDNEENNVRAVEVIENEALIKTERKNQLKQHLQSKDLALINECLQIIYYAREQAEIEQDYNMNLMNCFSQVKHLKNPILAIKTELYKLELKKHQDSDMRLIGQLVSRVMTDIIMRKLNLEEMDYILELSEFFNFLESQLDEIYNAYGIELQNFQNFHYLKIPELMFKSYESINPMPYYKNAMRFIR